MPFMGKFLAIAMLSLAFTASAGAQAPQVEKNVSMKMALMIIEGTLEQCTKDGYKGWQCRCVRPRRRDQSAHHGIWPPQGLYGSHSRPDLA